MEKSARPRSEFGLRLREARKESGLTQEQVAKSLGISQGTLSQAEKEGEGSVHVAAFASLLGVNPLWLATGEGPKRDENPVAQSVSLQSFTVPTLTKEELLSAQTLPAQFVFELLDDSMGSFGRAGTQVIFKAARHHSEAKPGAGVLFKDASGGLHVRRKRQGKTDDDWIAFAPNDAYASMSGKADGLAVLGVWIGVLNRGLEDA